MKPESDTTLRISWVPEWALLLGIAMFVLAIHGVRLTATPIRGEESRWARGAVQMLERGDWIVPRQQGQVFAERPPLNSWAMAAVGAVRGDVDLVAVRLPSVIATCLTSLLIFLYARGFLSQLGAFAAACCYAAFGQVLQLGRLGESEAIFTLFVSASLLLWHYGYMRGWPALGYWSAGYALAALAALAKGPQAPIYFVAATTGYLALGRRWSELFSWRHAAGIGVFFAVISAWMVPFFLATNWQSTLDIWTGLTSDRIGSHDLLMHIASYPLETFVCLLPWSVLLLQVIYRPVREGLAQWHGHVQFLLVALAVAYPTVWFAVGARGRYFMPLYPCIAVLIGAIVQSSLQADRSSAAYRGWRWFVWGVSGACAAAGVFAISAKLVSHSSFSIVDRSSVMLIVYCAAGFAVVLVGLLAAREKSAWGAAAFLAALTAFLGFSQAGVLQDFQQARANDMTVAVDQLRGQLPADAELVSLGPVYHRFAYYYRDPIKQAPWPESPEALPRGVEYFCFDRLPNDTPTSRQSGRGRTWSTTSGRLPFEWEKICELSCDPRHGDKLVRRVVIGRVLSPANSKTASLPDSLQNAKDGQLQQR